MSQALQPHFTAEAQRADFGYLRDALGLTPGNLSKHLTVLEEAGLIEVEKGYVGRRPRTWVRITPRVARYSPLNWPRVRPCEGLGCGMAAVVSRSSSASAHLLRHGLDSEESTRQSITILF